VSAYRLTIRRRGATERRRFDTLDQALTELEEQVRTLATGERRGRERALAREYEPIDLVAARAEITGPRRLRGGVDLRGDGSAEAFTGRLRRRVVEQAPGESASAALRRALAPDQASVSWEP